MGLIAQVVEANLLIECTKYWNFKNFLNWNRIPRIFISFESKLNSPSKSCSASRPTAPKRWFTNLQNFATFIKGVCENNIVIAEFYIPNVKRQQNIKFRKVRKETKVGNHCSSQGLMTGRNEYRSKEWLWSVMDEPELQLYVNINRYI